MKIKINMLSTAAKVSGQGVGSAYVEQVNLIKECSDLFEVSENAKRGHFDIYHIHTPNISYYLRMNKKHINIMYVHLLPETLDGSIKLPKLFLAVFKKYVVKMYRKADEIVVVNNSFINHLIALGIKKDAITYIPNYVDKTRFYVIEQNEINKIKKQLSIPLDKFVVLGCGQIQTRKGVKEFIEVALKMPDIQFIWAGGFSFGTITDGRKELQKIIDNPPKNVKFLGIVPREKMNEIFNISDMLFMPSLTELFPMSILEAANCNKPVLLRDLDIYKGILFEKYFKGKDINEWVREIKRVVSEQKYYKLGQQNSRYISDFYSKDRLKNVWRDYYCKIYEKYNS